MSEKWQFLLDELQTIDRPFQSLQPYLSSKHDLQRSCKWLVGAMQDAVDFEGLPRMWKYYIRVGFAVMIRSERIAKAQDHFVFYRSINHKYVLYEFNTFMLRALSTLPVPENETLCIPCLDESLFPDSLEELVATMRATDGTDSQRDTAQTVLSVNNCLVPTDINDIRLHGYHHHSKEASPMAFFVHGYDATRKYTETMEQFLEKVCMASPAAARRVVNRLMAYHIKLNPKRWPVDGDDDDDRMHVAGHMVQITIPRAQAARFVYPAAAYGKPLAIRMQGKKMHAHGELPEDGLGEGLEVLLDSENVAELQSRILAHPHLFCLHGATTRVFHANVHFNEMEYRRFMAEELGKWARIARLRTAGLKFNKFK